VACRGEKHARNAGQRRTQRAPVIERQEDRLQANGASQRLELRAIASCENRAMTAAYRFVENQPSCRAVGTVEHPIRACGFGHWLIQGGVVSKR